MEKGNKIKKMTPIIFTLIDQVHIREQSAIFHEIEMVRRMNKQWMLLKGLN